jgi:mannose-1-phosphate guanylyltransferase/mannose-6-phosphate isomerase
MKIRPIILCGGEGSRLWPNSDKNQAKQFIDFGGWNLLEKTLQRIKGPIFDYPIISTNKKYLKLVKAHLIKLKINKYKIISEPLKKNTAPAILISALVNLKHTTKKGNNTNQPLLFLPADHLIEDVSKFNKAITKNKKNLTDQNIFIFGIKPLGPSTEYGYFFTKKIKGSINKVERFVEKPTEFKANKIIKNKGLWNSGMLLSRTDSIINNFKKFSPNIYNSSMMTFVKTKEKSNIYNLNKNKFSKVPEKSFDYAILEKAKQINAIKLTIDWSDLGSWKEISKVFIKNKANYYKRENVYYRPWGNYVNLFKGKRFLIKELTVNSKASISLQKHHHRSEHWMITQGMPKITINRKTFFKYKNDSVFIPAGVIHRIENLYHKPVKILEVQTGSILKETDIVRFKDIYNRV